MAFLSILFKTSKRKRRQFSACAYASATDLIEGLSHVFDGMVVPGVDCRYHQCVASTGSSQAAAQLLEQAVCERLQGQHHQQGAQEETVGGLRKSKQAVAFV